MSPSNDSDGRGATDRLREIAALQTERLLLLARRDAELLRQPPPKDRLWLTIALVTLAGVAFFVCGMALELTLGR